MFRGNINVGLLTVAMTALTCSLVLPNVLCSNSSTLKPAENRDTSSATAVDRTGRLIKFIKESDVATPFTRAFNLKRAPSSQRIHSRSDKFTIPSLHRNVGVSYQNNVHNNHLIGPRIQMIRRNQNNIPYNVPLTGQLPIQHMRLQFESTKNTHFPTSNTKTTFDNIGKGSVFRPQFPVEHHPNALGNIDGPLQHFPQQHQHQHQHQQQQQFKASPLYNGKAIIRPLSETIEQQQHSQYQQGQQQQQQQSPYQIIKQYPIPQSPNYHQLKHSKQTIQTKHPILEQQNYYKGDFHNTNMKTKVYPSKQHNTYSVYEDSFGDGRAERQQSKAPNPSQINSNTDSVDGSLHYDAQNYLNFMSINEYFLPKREPNYKLIDSLKEQRPQQAQYSHNQQQQQQQQMYLTSGSLISSTLTSPLAAYNLHKDQHDRQYSKPLADTVGASAYQKPIQVSQLFYEEDPSPAIVRGSYQAGSNTFVVNSDGNRAVKHIVPSPSTQIGTSPSPIYDSTKTYRTPEPLRFEFTERDAVPGSYTNAPANEMKHYKTITSNNNQINNVNIDDYTVISSTPRYKFSVNSTTSTIRSRKVNSIKPVKDLDDDPEDGEDMDDASSHSFGLVSLLLNVSTSTETPVENKDNEEYCENICASVQDDDQEIVCGSDGYMYTSEAQMDCYATCLHIHVTIQGKGSCSAP